MLDPQASGYDEAPWLWSDQYDRNIQILGSRKRAAGPLCVTSRRARSTSPLNADGRLTQLVAFNNARIVKLAKRWMAAEGSLTSRSLTRLSR